MIEKLGNELKISLRTLLKRRGFSLVAVLTLTLGIGVNAAMFSVINGILLRPLGYRNPDGLMTVHLVVPTLQNTYSVLPVAGYCVSEWGRQARSIEGISAVSSTFQTLGGTGEPERITGIRVSPNFFDLLGVQPRLGRGFAPDEGRPDKWNVVVLSDGLWHRRFGGNASILGNTIELNGGMFRVIGILPADFHFPKNQELHPMVQMPEHTDLVIPLVMSPEEVQRPLNFNYAALVRLRSGVGPTVAKSELNGILKRLPNMPKRLDIQSQLTPLQSEMVAPVRRGMLVLMGAVAAVLLIACVNIVSMLLARGADKRREFAIRAALGASRLQLCLPPLAESLVLALIGGIAGTLLGYWLVELVVLKVPIHMPRMDEVSMDAPTLIFTLMVSLFAAVVCGLGPAWRSSKVNPASVLKQAAGDFKGGQGAARLRSNLIALESGISLVLLVVAGLLIHSYLNVTSVDQGFRPAGVITAQVAVSGKMYQDDQRRRAFYQNVLAGLASLPATKAAGAASVLPLTGETNISGIISEDDSTAAALPPQAEYRIASAGYFAAAGIPLIRGQLFDDRPGGNKVAVISPRTAERIWPGRDPIGRRFNLSDAGGITVIGIVGDIRSKSLESDPPPMVYLPLAQSAPNTMTVVVTDDPSPGQAIRHTVAMIDPTIPVTKLRPFEDVIDGANASRRFQTILLTGFAALALILAAIGVYGVVSYSVSQRRTELGIRIALGAGRGRILGIVFRTALRPVAAGMVLGLVVAASISRLITPMLYSVSAFDAPAFLLGVVWLGVVAMAACWFPASSATRIDPLASIKWE